MSGSSPPPLSRRRVLVLPFALAMLSMLGPFSIDTPFPAFGDIQRDFGVDASATQQIVSSYLLAFALMSIFHGPISDAVGRRPVMTTGLVVFAVASAGCALAPNLPVLLAFRVLQGLSAGAGVIVSRTIIRDLYDGPEAQRQMSRVMMIFGLGPAIAPVIGGFLLEVGPWPVIFWFLVAVGVALIAVVAVLVPETHPPERRTPVRVGAILGSLVAIVRAPAFHRVAWAGALSFGGQFLYIGAAAIFVVDLLGKGERDFWVFFVPMIGCVVAGAGISSRMSGRISTRRLITLALTGALVAGGVNVAISATPLGDELPWAVLGPSLVALGVATGFPSLQLAVLDMFPATRGAAASAASFFALVLNAVTAGLLAPVVTRSVTTLAVTCWVMVALGWGLWLWHLRTLRREEARDRRPADADRRDAADCDPATQV